MNIQDANLPQSPHWDCNSFWIGFRVISPIKEPTDAEKLKFWDLNDPETTKTLERDREVRDIPTCDK